MNFTVRKKHGGDPPMTRPELIDMLNNGGGFMATAKKLKLSKVTIGSYMRYYGIKRKNIWE